MYSELIKRLLIAKNKVHTIPNSAVRLYGEAADALGSQAKELAAAKTENSRLLQAN